MAKWCPNYTIANKGAYISRWNEQIVIANQGSFWKWKGVGRNLNFKGKSSYKRMRCLINLNTPISKSFFENTLANSINKHATSIDWKNDNCITERWNRSRTYSGNIVNIFSNLSDCFAGYTSAISRHSCLTVNKVFKDAIRKISQWMSS